MSLLLFTGRVGPLNLAKSELVAYLIKNPVGQNQERDDSGDGTQNDLSVGPSRNLLD